MIKKVDCRVLESRSLAVNGKRQRQQSRAQSTSDRPEPKPRPDKVAPPDVVRDVEQVHSPRSIPRQGHPGILSKIAKYFELDLPSWGLVLDAVM